MIALDHADAHVGTLCLQTGMIDITDQSYQDCATALREEILDKVVQFVKDANDQLSFGLATPVIKQDLVSLALQAILDKFKASQEKDSSLTMPSNQLFTRYSDRCEIIKGVFSYCMATSTAATGIATSAPTNMGLLVAKNA